MDWYIILFTDVVQFYQHVCSKNQSLKGHFNNNEWKSVFVESV